MTTTYAIKNITQDDVGVGAFVWKAGETKNLRKAQITPEIVALTDAGTKLYCATDLSPLGGLSAAANAMVEVTYSGGGTPIAAVDGVKTIPTITADASAQNAFATLFVELAAARAAIDTLVAQVEALKAEHA